MTADRRAALVRMVCRAICQAENGPCDEPICVAENGCTFWTPHAEAAIDLIRAEVLEEAAELVEQHTPRYGDGDFHGHLVRRMAYDSIGLPYAAAIRALKGTT